MVYRPHHEGFDEGAIDVPNTEVERATSDPVGSRDVYGKWELGDFGNTGDDPIDNERPVNIIE